MSLCKHIESIVNGVFPDVDTLPFLILYLPSLSLILLHKLIN